MGVWNFVTNFAILLQRRFDSLVKNAGGEEKVCVECYSVIKRFKKNRISIGKDIG